ncbi:hypothetical protein [Bacillus sp. UNC41MFS5]|nr:hypothetical protein [Bacillus sp. UNC41MFS5]
MERSSPYAAKRALALFVLSIIITRPLSTYMLIIGQEFGAFLEK